MGTIPTVARVTAVAWVRSLAPEFPHAAADAAKKKRGGQGQGGLVRGGRYPPNPCRLSFFLAAREQGWKEAVQLPSVLLAPLPGNCPPMSALCSGGGGGHIPPRPSGQDEELCPRQGCTT